MQTCFILRGPALGCVFGSLENRNIYISRKNTLVCCLTFMHTQKKHKTHKKPKSRGYSIWEICLSGVVNQEDGFLEVVCLGRSSLGML